VLQNVLKIKARSPECVEVSLMRIVASRITPSYGSNAVPT
jgi:hypothetical protein